MAFPTIPTVGAGRVLTNVIANATSPRTFPSLSGLTKNSGDLLIALIAVYQSSAASGAVFSSWGASFTEFADLGGTTSNMSIGGAYKFSNGTETGTFTVAQAATITGHAACILLSIPGAHPSTAPETGGLFHGTGSAPASGLTGPSWGAADTLWISVACSGETSTTGSYTGITNNGGDFTDVAKTGISADAVGGVELGVAFEQLNTSANQANGWNLDTSNARNSHFTVMVRPVPSVVLPPQIKGPDVWPNNTVQGRSRW